VKATELRLKKRRKARKPDMPIPRRAIEVGSGMIVELTATVLLVLAEVPENEKLLKVTGELLPVVKVNTKAPLATGLKVKWTVFAPGVGAPSVKVGEVIFVELVSVIGKPMGSTAGV
jgi:hypothetical protein